MAAESFRLLADAGTPAVQELVYGLPMEAPARVGAEFGVPLRVYIPYGHAWIPYAAKRAIADPRVFYWLARDILSRGRDPLPPARV
jgi:proline dehydrogenase